MAKSLIGKVVSVKTPKTAIVLVKRKFRNPMYHKVIKRSKRFKVHQDKIIAQVGDEVMIEETKPISKDKHFILIKNFKNKSKK